MVLEQELIWKLGKFVPVNFYIFYFILFQLSEIIYSFYFFIVLLLVIEQNCRHGIFIINIHV